MDNSGDSGASGGSGAPSQPQLLERKRQREHWEQVSLDEHFGSAWRMPLESAVVCAQEIHWLEVLHVAWDPEMAVAHKELKGLQDMEAAYILSRHITKNAALRIGWRDIAPT